jgi:hypothetical protein
MDRVFIYGDRSNRIVSESARLVSDLGMTETTILRSAHLALAPLLTRRLAVEEIATPTLIFHPSLLPRHRGPDSIRWALAAREAYSGVTWFWANARLDRGEICEQGVVEVYEGDSPRSFYERAVDEGLRLLRYALLDLQAGHVRRRPQRLAAVTYEGFARPPITDVIAAHGK